MTQWSRFEQALAPGGDVVDAIASGRKRCTLPDAAGPRTSAMQAEPGRAADVVQQPTSLRPRTIWSHRTEIRVIPNRSVKGISRLTPYCRSDCC